MELIETKLYDICLHLESTKIKTRENAQDDCLEFLQEKRNVDFMEKDTSYFCKLFKAIETSLKYDSEKIVKDAQKKGVPPETCSIRPKGPDLMYLLIKTASKNKALAIPITKIIALMDTNSKICYMFIYIRIINELLLINPDVRKTLRAQDWESLFLLIKSYLEINRKHTEQIMESLILIIKWGSSYSLPPHMIRESFDFIRSMFDNIKITSPFPLQSISIQLATEFCTQTAEDNRIACCKLGEDIIPLTVELYTQRSRDQNFKLNLIDFYILQISLHNPKGVGSGHLAYASSPKTWPNRLKSLQCLLYSDVKMTMNQSTNHLSTTHNGITRFKPNFIHLFVEVSRQLWFIDKNASSDAEQPQKRQKIDNMLSKLISHVEDSQSWAWLSLLASLLAKYPEIIAESEFFRLLQLLETFIKTDKKQNLNFRHHAFKALVALEKAETYVEMGRFSAGIGALWAGIGQSVLRVMNLPQNEEEVHYLARKMVKNPANITPEALLRHYCPKNGIKVSVPTLETLFAIFAEFPHLQCDNAKKMDLIAWILRPENWRSFNLSLVAQILFNCALKQWQISDLGISSSEQFSEIEDIYFQTAFEEFLVDKVQNNVVVKNSVYCVDRALLEKLVASLLDLGGSFEENKENDCDCYDKSLSFAILVLRLLNSFNECKIVSEAITEPLWQLFGDLAASIFQFSTDEFDGEAIKEKLANFELLFSVHSARFRALLPKEFIKNFFNILTMDMDGRLELDLKRSAVRILIYYSLTETMTEIQGMAMKALINFEFDCNGDLHFGLVVTILEMVIHCEPKQLSEEIVASLFNLFKNLCHSRYESSSATIKILEIFLGLFPLVVGATSYRDQFVEILYPFYEHVDRYGPRVAINLVKCMGLIYVVDPLCRNYHWGHEAVIYKVPVFLCHNYQAVRFAAIRIIVKFFELSSKDLNLERFHLQEIMFAKIDPMCTKMFEIKSALTKERIMDETVTRSASFLHIYSGIILTSNLWIKRACLITILRNDKIDKELIIRVIARLAENLGFSSGLAFIEKYLVVLYNEWNDVNCFPYFIYKCATKEEFYLKYFRILCPYIVENDLDYLLSENFTNFVNDVPVGRNISYCLAKYQNEVQFKNCKVYKFSAKILKTEQIDEEIKANIEDILLNLSMLICDESDFTKTFDEKVIFTNLNVLKLDEANFNNCIKFLEEIVYNGMDLVQLLMNDKPKIVHNILLQIRLKMEKTQAVEEKIRYFHSYQILTDLCLEALLKNYNVNETYFIRTLIYTLLHMIKRSDIKILQLIACKYLKIVMEKIVPSLAKSVELFLVFIVSRLKSLLIENSQISVVCKSILSFLIVDHNSVFMFEIGQLENILPEFSGVLQKSQEKLALKNRIKLFLHLTESIEDVEDCDFALHDLKSALSNRLELQEFVKDIQEQNKYSDLHKLICCLIKLTYSTNSKVSAEALFCLGEIGPCNLGTLVLQPEKPIPDSSLAPIELLLEQAIVLLTKYIVDTNVEVIQCATNALVSIFATKEGYKLTLNEIDYGFGIAKFKFFTTFISACKSRNSINLKVDLKVFISKVSDDEVWVPMTSNCHKMWVTNLVVLLLECFQDTQCFATFIPVARLKVEFCELILPLIIFTIVYRNNSSLTFLLSEKIAKFFQTHWDITVLNTKSASTITVNKSSIQCMLNVVDFIRLQNNNRLKRPNKELVIDYLKAAKAAQFCSSHFTTLLYCELWCKAISTEQVPFDKQTQLDLNIQNLNDEVTSNAIQNMLRESYKSIGEIDGLNGCGAFYLTNSRNCIEHYKDLGQWERVAFYTEIAMMDHKDTSLLPLNDSLKQAGHFELSNVSWKSRQEPDYECLWRLGLWNHDSSDCKVQNYDKFKFGAFKALHEEDEINFVQATTQMQNCIVENLHRVNLDSTSNFYGTLTQLQSLKEIEDFYQAFKDKRKLAFLLETWQNEANLNDFQYIEPIKAQRNLILTAFHQTNSPEFRNQTIDLLLDFASYARIEDKPLVAFRSLKSLTKIPNLPPEIVSRIQLEQAQLCLLTENAEQAECLLHKLCMGETSPHLRATALKIKGQWMAERSEESCQSIIENYFLKSIDLLRDRTDEEETIKLIVGTYIQLGKLADRKYQQVMSHIKSDIYQRKLDNLKKLKETMNTSKYKDPTKMSDELKRSMAIKCKQISLDETEIKEIENEQNELFKVALKYYFLTLIYSDDNNILIFRFVALLLENRSNEMTKKILKKEITKIPTAKFITILPQLMPHITNAQDEFCVGITRLIENCAKEHPHHTLPLILSLAYANKDRDYFKSSKEIANDDRIRNAKQILARLKKQAAISALIGRMEQLSEALIEVAYYKSENGKFGPKLKIRKIKQFDDVLVPTYNLGVRHDKIVGIASFDDAYSSVGGINEPKRIICRGTDGIGRTQLIKGRDDLRQDAVMEQVFTIMNSLLSPNKQTKNLKIRTYKIVPLSMRSGILEWVDNSLTFGEYLTGDDGAHEKYRPMDKTPKRCRADFSKISNSTASEKLAVFKKICAGIQPVFHNFFLSTFPQACVWYERRRAYIHSVATSSMCGYILGIGDRHVNNILLDKSTAEVIHIDFGIAFEQGRILPTPETIPFRLTRDVADGMGVAGVEGLFRRSCERTMEVLRLNEQTIMTILEVLLYDPLYEWSVSANEAKRRQRADEGEVSMWGEGSDWRGEAVNVTAERALLRLKAKLQGTENGAMMTVENQVRYLIQEAKDPANLCRLYSGWQPYL